ncbi:hypothetical protein SKAU_G00171960 [Synaphobranchus kaupii]|uniref:Uncharacterized protein n=1 Tax=Synaphobranchus kaupii TaxID=118154 RepID=A0A9Q1FKR5_SYNKA|nr:hypothetical protein SKAU_G00171960 [Synaphobranchus kaupii]
MLPQLDTLKDLVQSERENAERAKTRQRLLNRRLMMPPRTCRLYRTNWSSCDRKPRMGRKTQRGALGTD